LVRSIDSAATRLMCDLAKYQRGAISLDDIRQRWSKGIYSKAPQEWALAAIAHARQ